MCELLYILGLSRGVKNYPTKLDEHVLPSPELLGDAMLSLLDSRAILFRANKALPAFYLTMKKSGKEKPNSLNGRVNMKTVD